MNFPLPATNHVTGTVEYHQLAPPPIWSAVGCSDVALHQRYSSDLHGSTQTWSTIRGKFFSFLTLAFHSWHNPKGTDTHHWCRFESSLCSTNLKHTHTQNFCSVPKWPVTLHYLECGWCLQRHNCFYGQAQRALWTAALYLPLLAWNT